MARRQILSLSERESLLALPDDELTLTRMAYFSEQDLALINAHRKSSNRFGFAVLLCYLKSIGFAPDKKSPPSAELLRIIGSRLKLAAELWLEYISGRDTTRREHLSELYRYLELTTFNRALQKECIQYLLPLSIRTDRGILIATVPLDNNKYNLIFTYRDGADLKEQIDELFDEIYSTAEIRNCVVGDITLTNDATNQGWNEYDGGWQ